MKTSFKRFAALVLAAIMVLGTMNLSAWADTTAVGNRTLDNKLTISGLEKGDIVRFYQVFEENEDAVDDGGWIYTSSFIGMSRDNGIRVSQITGNPAKSQPHQLTAEIAGQIAALTVAATPSKTVEADANGIATWESGPVPAAGMYVAIITPKDVETVYNPVFVSADYVTTNPSASWNIITSSSTYSDKAAAKKTKITIEKSASTEEDLWDDKSAYTTAIGDSVSFYVNTTVPGYGKASMYPSFEIKDSLSGLDLITTTLKVYDFTGGSKVGEITDSAFAKQATTSGYTITFKEDWLKNLKAPLNIRVEYEARVNIDAKDNVNIENNTVTVKFSTNPSNSTDFAVKKDETNHYTFTIDANSLFEGDKIKGSKGSELVKIGLDAAGNPIKTSRVTSEVTTTEHVDGPLQGAEFKLYTDANCTEEYKPKDPTTGIRSSKGLALVSGADGRFTIPGLDAGTYYLKETKAPDGFIKCQDTIKIIIDPTIEPNKTVTKWYFNDNWYDDEATARQKAKDAGYIDSTIPTSSTRTINEVVKEYTYTTDVMTSYRVYIGDKDMTTENMQKAALYTFANSATSSEIHISETKPVELPFSIPNTQGVELPSTGGIGTTIFYAGGAMLVLLAGILLVSKRRIA